MKYRNKKTGVVIEVSSVCSGEDWEEVKEVVEAKTVKKTKRKEVVNNERPVNG